jgi:DNA-binding transcriptional LysR family regulator
MDIHQLELFLAFMDPPSMTRAAEKIHLSPGAVGLQLHNLADELHTELFVRRGKKLVATPAALRLAEHAKEVVRMMATSSSFLKTIWPKMCTPSISQRALLP